MPSSSSCTLVQYGSGAKAHSALRWSGRTLVRLRREKYMRSSVSVRAAVSVKVLFLGLFGAAACSAPAGSSEPIAGEAREALTTVDDQVMRVVGRKLLDSNGVSFLTRGIEGWFGPAAQANMATLVDGIASQGFNAARLQLLTTDLTKIEALIKRFHTKNMVVYL